MWGFQLVRGGNVVYNLTGATVGHPFHDSAPPKWAAGVDGLDITEVVKKLKPDDPAKTDLLTACGLELARFTRSQSKMGGEACTVKLVVT